jgi:hypothetical protein
MVMRGCNGGEANIAFFVLFWVWIMNTEGFGGRCSLRFQGRSNNTFNFSTNSTVNLFVHLNILHRHLNLKKKLQIIAILVLI